MTNRQNRAIGYSIRNKQRERCHSFLREHDLVKKYEQSEYKTYRGFICKHFGAETYNRVIGGELSYGNL